MELADGLNALDVPFWLDSKRIAFGNQFVLHIAEALENSDWYVLIHPSTSLASYWVLREYWSALRLSTSHRSPSIATLGVTGQDLGRGVHTFEDVAHILEFFRVNNRSIAVGSDHQGALRNSVTDFEGKPFTHQPRGPWFGHSDVLRQLDYWLLSDHSPGIIVHGESAVGKTALIFNWLFAVHRLGYEYETPVLIRTFDGRILPDETELTFPALVSSPRIRLLVIDSAEMMSSEHLSTTCRRAAAFSVRVVLVGQMDSAPATFKRVQIKRLNERDVLLMATQAGLSSVEAQVLVKLSEGLPVPLSTYLERLREHWR